VTRGVKENGGPPRRAAHGGKRFPRAWLSYAKCRASARARVSEDKIFLAGRRNGRSGRASTVQTAEPAAGATLASRRRPGLASAAARHPPRAHRVRCTTPGLRACHERASAATTCCCPCAKIATSRWASQPAFLARGRPSMAEGALFVFRPFSRCMCMLRFLNSQTAQLPTAVIHGIDRARRNRATGG
jgi:hypothetical protein